jgi:hypothetical protein
MDQVSVKGESYAALSFEIFPAACLVWFSDGYLSYILNNIDIR